MKSVIHYPTNLAIEPREGISTKWLKTHNSHPLIAVVFDEEELFYIPEDSGNRWG